MRRGGGRGPAEDAEGTSGREPESKAEAEARKASAEADKARTEAGSAAFSAAFPSSKAKAREGTLKVEGKIGFTSDLVAHAMLRRAGEEVRNEIRGLLKKEGMRILLVSSPDLVGSDWPYMAISSELRRKKQELRRIEALLLGRLPGLEDVRRRQLEAELEAEEGLALQRAFFTMPPGIGEGIQAAASLVGGVAEIAALFRADYEIHGREVSIGSSPLLAAVAHFLIDKVEEVNVEDFSLLKRSRLIADFVDVARLRMQVQRLATEAKQSKLATADRRLERAKEAYAAYLAAVGGEAKPGEKESLDDLWRRIRLLENQASAADEALAPARAAVAVAEAAIKDFDAFAASVVKPPEKGGSHPPLIAAAIQERLHSRTGHTHVLYAGVDGAGGETINRRSFLKASVRFLGGAQVTYMLWDVKREKLVAADTKPFLAEVKMGLGSGGTGGIQAVPLT